ncbi:MAG: class I SAM-dependent methyltransferase [Oscillospiraceae bacterium]|nr:class I SAM-dependent methyltransferase [Oscillospiraceae bacterium]
MKLGIENTRAEYSVDAVVEEYSDSVENVGLWLSERMIFAEYLDRQDRILDIGCGAGRVSFGLHRMGFHHISGLDLSEPMIEAAVKFSQTYGADIPFVTGSACRLPFDRDSFDAAIFAFNGIMTISDKHARQKAFDEISRVLRQGGKFIFTTHYMDDPRFTQYWKDERDKWDNNEQDKRLVEYGDVIFVSDEKYGDAISFVHIPENGEVEDYLGNSGFDLVFSKPRSEICAEESAVLSFAGDCKFWVCIKRGSV